jgi:EmrB/QacA subfamily drug resistance transporter
MFLAVVDQTIVATALPAIAASLGSVGRVSWVVVAYLVAATVAAPLYGQLRDIYSARRMLIIGLAIFLAASLFCSLATSIEMLTIARALQGLGGGALMTLSQALIGETIPPRERARYQGYLAAVMVTSSVFGPVAGGYLTWHFGWRSIFLINLPLSLLAMALSLRLEPGRTRVKNWSFDLWGLVFYVATLTPGLLALEQVQTLQGGSARVFALSAFALLALILLVHQERRAPYPLLPIALLRQSTIWRSDALAACHGAILVSLVTFLPLFLHVDRQSSAADTGLQLLPLMCGIGIGSMLTGRIVSRTGYTTIMPSCGLVIATAGLTLLAFEAGHMSGKALGWLLLFSGLSMGTVMGVVQVTVQNAAGGANLGAAAASVQLSRSVGAAVGTALVGSVLFGWIAHGTPPTAAYFSEMVAQTVPLERLPAERQVLGEIEMAFRAAFLTIAAFAALGAALAWSIPSRRLG